MSINFGKKTVAATACAFLPFAAGASTTFGIYDARSMAMGGAVVGSANNDNGQFYNSALLAFNDEIEERTQDGRFLFPILSPQISQSAFDIEEIASDDLAASLSRAVNAYNALPGPTSAQGVVDASATLDSSLATLSDEDVFGDMYVGLAISEPGRYQGAGFFMGARLLGGGRAAVSDADRALLNDYREALQFVASNGAQGSAHPELFDAGGALINPQGNFDSSLTAVGAAITEIGVAMSHQFDWFGGPIAAGFSFKVVGIDTFEDAERIVDNRIDVERNSEYDINLNFDVGLAKQFGERWRVGLAIKDIIPHNYETSLGSRVRLRPRARVGVAYQRGRLQTAWDVDVVENEPFANERATQETAVGLEWAFDFPLKLRAGYRHDLLGHRAGVASIGLGTLWKRFAFDVAYAEGSDLRSAAIQFGYAF